MRALVQRIAVFGTLAVTACSGRNPPGEDVGHAASAQHPVLGPREAGWRLPTTGDLDGDGLQDLVWRHHEDNRFAATLMSGARIREQGPMMAGPPGEGWIVIIAIGDRNLDGLSDMLWYNTTTHRIAVWLMAGTAPFDRGPEIPPPSEDAYAVAAGDFNRDGMVDVLWFDPTTHRMTVWLMRGTEPFDRGPEIQGPPGGDWYPAFAADFDLDGMADVLWHDPEANRMAVWLMSDTVVRGRGPELPTPSGRDWIVASAGDFNHDGMADVLWWSESAQRMTVSLMRGTGLLEQGPEIAGPEGARWTAGTAGDSNGDGMSDVFFFDTNPLRIRVWLMNGAVPVIRGPEILGPI